MKYLILYPFFNLTGLLVYAFVNLNLQVIKCLCWIVFDLDRAYENKVLKKTKEYREFEKRIDNLF